MERLRSDIHVNRLAQVDRRHQGSEGSYEEQLAQSKKEVMALCLYSNTPC